MRRAIGMAAAIAAAPAVLAAQAAEEAAFVIELRADTFAVENFTRSADRVEGTLVGAAIGRIVYALDLGPASTTRELRLRAWRPGAAADAEPAQVARLTLDGDTVAVEITTSAGTQSDRLATAVDALLYLNPSMAQLEQVVRRAAELGTDPAEVALMLAQGGQTVTATVAREGADSVVVRFAGAEIRAAVAPDGRVLGGTIPAQGLRFTRTATVLPTVAAPEPPDYSAPEAAPYTAEEVVVATMAGHRLVGTLTLPRTADAVPTVVMITGSGAQDRDQALPILPGYRPFRDIADTLSRRGIAVLRLDDRGTGASTGDFGSATSADFADDIRAALDYLRGRPDIDTGRLGLVGHSEGGIIAPMIAAIDPELRAIALIAAPARTGREIIAFQQRQAIEANVAIPEASRDSAFAALQEGFYARAADQPWIRFFLDHDPLPTARSVADAAVLILQGATDRQVPADQAEMLADAFRAGGNPDVTVRIVPDVNHLLLHDPDGSPAGYITLPGRTVVAEVRGVLADWLAERLQ